MELRVLTYFLMVAREENITKASQLLHITQPTLSRQLIQLEDELGVKLFVRGSQRLSLTEDGMLLKTRAQDIVSLADKTVLEFKAAKEDLSGEISIGGGELLGMDYFIKIIAEFKKKNPNVRFNIRTGTADDVKDRIESGLLDIGILTFPGDISKYESVLLPEHEVYGVIVNNDSELAKKDFIEVKDLIDKPLIVTTRAHSSKILANWFGAVYDKLNIVANFNFTYNAATMVRNKIGVAIGIKLNWEFEGLTFVPIYPQIETSTYFVWKKNETHSRATAEFIEFAKNWIKG